MAWLINLIKKLLGLFSNEPDVNIEINTHEEDDKPKVSYVWLNRSRRRALARLIENLDGVEVDHADIANKMSVTEITWWVQRGIKHGKDTNDVTRGLDL